MIKNFKLTGGVALMGVLAYSILPQPAFASDLVSDDLITGSSQTTPWLVCDEDTPAEVVTLEAGGCAYRGTPVEAGGTYRMSCGVTVAKFASITLAFLDAADVTLDSKSTEVTEHVSGAYSVTLAAPAGTATAAIGIYGEPGSGFQDCVLIDVTPQPEPTKGSITGVTWFDENGDSVFDAGEGPIAGTDVTLFSGANLIAQTQTDANGAYNFGHLDVGVCYTASFSAADSTLELGFAGGENDALADGTTNEICLTDDAPNVVDIDAAYVAIPPVVPPADSVICGYAWADLNSNGTFDGTDTTLPHVAATLFDAITNKQLEATKTNADGNYSFFSLATGDYYVQFTTPDGYEATTPSDQPRSGASFIGSTGRTGSFSLPVEENIGMACSAPNVNAGYVQLPVALDPTIANRDRVRRDEGVDFTVDILANDTICEGTAVEFDLLGHNVPGMVTYDEATQQILVSNTTDHGRYTITYGVRGACGSYDTANVIVILNEVVPPAPPAAPDAPVCRAETGGSERIGGADVFNAAENGFSPNYNFYDRDRNLLVTVDSTDFTSLLFIGTEFSTNPFREQFIGNYEMEWNGRDYGFDQVAVFYASAIENGIESSLSECVRTMSSPIALDLGNHGRIERVVGDYSVDVDGDGIEEPLGQWFAPSAGILVTADAKGQITGKHMFGNVPGVYSDGFEELATLDANLDGQLTGKELSALAIWTDLNSDTVVDEGELSSIAANQIVALSVEHYKYMARATTADGKSVLMEDVWLPLAPLASR